MLSVPNLSLSCDRCYFVPSSLLLHIHLTIFISVRSDALWVPLLLVMLSCFSSCNMIPLTALLSQRHVLCRKRGVNCVNLLQPYHTLFVTAKLAVLCTLRLSAEVAKRFHHLTLTIVTYIKFVYFIFNCRNLASFTKNTNEPFTCRL